MAYSSAIPFSKGPDEYINYQYILFIAKHHRLPTMIAEKKEAGVKADWQPLYHLLGGLVAAPISLTPPPELKVTWEPAARQLIDLVLPRATLIRTEDERPPYRGVYAVWQVGRWVSMVLGAGTLVVTYLIGASLWPGQPALATAVTALLVFMPRFLFTHAVLSDDTLLGFCLALYLLLLTRLTSRLNDPKTRNWLFVGLGTVAGLAIVTKYSAIPVIVGTIIVGGCVARRQGWARRNLLQGSALFVGSLALAVGWWVGWVWQHFNQVDNLGLIMGLIRPLLPGAAVDDNPTTARLTALLSGQPAASLGEAPGAGGSLFDWAWHTFLTFWGVTVFGAEPDWPYPYGAILIGLALFCSLAIGGLAWGYRRKLLLNKAIWYTFILHVLLFLPLPLLRFVLSRRLNDAAQGRHLLFPAGPAIVVLVMVGWLAWFRPQWRNRVALITAGLMMIWAIGHLLYLGLAYPPPLPVRTTPGPQVQVEQPSQVNFGDVLMLTGYQTKLINHGMVLQVDLLWRSLNQAWEDYRTEITLVDRRKQPQLRWMSHPDNGRFPVRAWQPGDIVRDTLYIPLQGLAPGDYEIQLRLPGWNEPLSSTQGEVVTLTSVTLGNIPQLTTTALWRQGKMVAEESSAYSLASSFPPLLASSPRPVTYRYRSTIPVTLPQPADAVLIGPDGQSWMPVTDLGQLAIFMVEYNWPSGVYRLQIDAATTDLRLQVDNFDRRPGGWNFTPPAMMYTVQANFADQIKLLGYDLPLRRVKAGDGIPLVLYWQSLTQIREDYTIFVQLLDANQERRGGYDRFPRETYNTYLWAPGEVVDDGFAAPVDNDAPNGVYTIRLGLYRQEAGQAIPLPLMREGHPLDETSVVIGPIKVGGPPAGLVVESISPEYPLNITLGETIALRGYDLTTTPTKLGLDLYWQSLRPTNVDYTVFVHLRDHIGQVVAQIDGPPVQGEYPTSLWDSEELIAAPFVLDLPPGLEPGVYQLFVGLYDPLTGLRLTVPQTADHSILLTEINLAQE